MRTRRLGGNGLEVPVIGLGCMVMPGFYAPGNATQSIATLRRTGEIRVNFLDSSDLYGAGKNKELLARVLADGRDRVIVAISGTRRVEHLEANAAAAEIAARDAACPPGAASGTRYPEGQMAVLHR